MTSISIKIVRSHLDQASEGEVIGVRREKTQAGEIGRENYFGGINRGDGVGETENENERE